MSGQFWEQRTQGRLLRLLCPKKQKCCVESGGGLERCIEEVFQHGGMSVATCHPIGRGRPGGNVVPAMMENSCNCLRLHFLPLCRIGLVPF